MNSLRPHSPSGVPFLWIEKEALKRIQSSDSSLKVSLIGVYVALAQLTSDSGGKPFQKPVGLIASLAGLRDRTVQKSLKTLEAMELVQIERNQNDSLGYIPNTYSLCGVGEHTPPTVLNTPAGVLNAGAGVFIDERDECTLLKELKESKELKELSPKPSALDPCEQIYRLYPKKVAKGSAIKAIAKALKTVSFEVLSTKVSRYAESRVGEESKFTPNPASWFNAQRWEDDESTWFQGKSSSRDVSGLEVISETDEETIYRDPSSNDGMRRVKK